MSDSHEAPACDECGRDDEECVFCSDCAAMSCACTCGVECTNCHSPLMFDDEGDLCEGCA